MPISTIKSRNEFSFSTALMYLLAVGGIVAVIYFSSQLINSLGGLKGRSALTVSVYTGDGEVLLNGTNLGKTPYSSRDIVPGENKITVKNSTRTYETTIDFIASDKKYIHNVGLTIDLGTSDMFSSAQEVWFEHDRSGNVLRVVSEPAGATVFIDNNEVGKTPYSSDKLSEGGYDLRVDYPGYEPQLGRINTKKDYALNVKFKLFPVPAPANVKLLEGATDLYNLSTDNSGLQSDTQDWVRGLIYWNKTRGLNVESTGLNKELVFDYYIDYKGNIFNKNGEAVTGTTGLADLKTATKGGYLGRTSDGTGITKEAKDALASLQKSGVGGKTATVLETGLGWLRVRDSASLTGAEIARVNVGQTYDVLEQATGWVKIKVSDTVQGWVSADYVKLSE
jgi:hypothetical protein